MAKEDIKKRKKKKTESQQEQEEDNTMRKKEKKTKMAKSNDQEQQEETGDVPIREKKSKKNNKRKLQQQDEEEELDHDKPRAKQNKRNENIITDERFASVHYDPRFQRVPRKESKVQVDSRFARMLTDKNFGGSSAPVDKRGKLKKEKAVNPLAHYYEEEKEEDDEERERKSEMKLSDDEDDDGDEGLMDESQSSSSDDEDEDDYDEENDQDLIQSDITRYLMASHEDTPLIEEETHRLAVVNMDWDHIKADDLYVAINSCLPKGGQILSVGIYPSEFGIKCMAVEAVHGPSALFDKNEDHSGDESESDDESIVNEKLRGYELNKLRYYYGVVVFDSSATANYVYKNLDGTELLRTSNVFDLRFIPDAMEFKQPSRDTTTEAPANYSMPDFHTRALQHSNVKLTWEEDEPRRTKILRRKFDADQLDELNEYLASSDSDADEEKGGSEGSDNSDAEDLSTNKTEKHMDKEKLRALLLSGNGSGSDKDDDEKKDMEITFNTGLENISKRILEKKDKKSETVWEQVLRKKMEKKKARKNRSKYSSDDDSSESDVPEAGDQREDFFMEEEPLDSKTKKGKHKKSNKEEREESPDIDKEVEATKEELELLFAEDQDGKDNGPKGYKLKPKKVKGKKGKEAAIDAKLPDVDPASDPRFSALFSSNLYALDPTDPQYKRSATYARKQLGKRGTVKDRKRAEESTISSEQIDNDLVTTKTDRHELSSTVKSLKRNLGNLKKNSNSK